MTETDLQTTVTEVATEVSEFQTKLSQLGSDALNFVIRVAIAIVIYMVIRRVLNAMLRLMVNRMKKRGVDPTVYNFLVAVLRYGILGFVIVTIVVQLDIVAASSIAALLAAAGVGISLAAQGALSNFAGGLLILLLKPFKVGDYIQISGSDIEGVVKVISIYYTQIETLYGDKYEIPNSSLTNNTVRNMNSNYMRKLRIEVGISYDEDVEKCLKVLQDIMDGEPRLLDGYNRRVFVEELGAHSVVIGFWAMVPINLYYATRWDLNQKVRVTFQELGIEIPYEQLDIHIKDVPIEIKNKL
ncbi:MAG: mechanosensitive ion channel family protein [Butyrivibrio sp.]|nr:mechanosensitive ion channel family protein [Butyrivibrio sp.]